MRGEGKGNFTMTTGTKHQDSVSERAMRALKPYHEEDSVTIYHGDCRQIMPMLGRFDLLLTDPPYGIGKWSANSTGGFMSKEEATKLDWDSVPPPPWLLHMLIDSCDKSIVWGGNYMGLPPSSRVLVWDKQNKGMHFAEAEVAWTNFTTGTTRILNLGIKGTEVFGVSSEREHPTQKPLSLIQWCIQQAGEPKTVLDPFAGSGTTGRAAKNLGVRAVLIEREERYCEIAARRLAQDVLALD